MKKNTGSEGTFRTVRGRYQDWFGAGDRGFLPGRTVVSDDDFYDRPGAGDGGGEMSKMVLMAIGGGIGVVLLALAALSFVNAGQWADIARDGAGVGYGLVGFFLVIAGLGGILATFNHLFRAANPSHH